jgi:predicted nucleic acid-binding protein
MKRVLIDTNVILDIALKRQPFFDSSSEFFYLIDLDKIAGFVTATTITDIYYISKKETNSETAIHFISGLLDIVDIVGVDKEVIVNALHSGMKDFEDAVQVSAAEYNEIRIIVTRNKADFNGCGLEIFTPDEFIKIV